MGRNRLATWGGMNRTERLSFWGEALALRGAATARVLPNVVVFGLLAVVITYVEKSETLPTIGVEVAPYEVAGAVLSLLLVVRTNAGYDRWWEARRTWGSIVNSARNLAIAALAFGPRDPAWRQDVLRWTIAFAHATRRYLRSEREMPEVATLLGDDRAAEISRAEHMPAFVALRLAQLLHDAQAHLALDGFQFLQADRERAILIEQVGVCERILRTPLPKVETILVRRFIVLFLATLPLALVLRVGWLTPLVTMFVAYPVLSLDQMGAELQSPFDTRRLSHLPLDEITAGIERNLLALCAENTSSA